MIKSHATGVGHDRRFILHLSTSPRDTQPPSYHKVALEAIDAAPVNYSTNADHLAITEERQKQ